MTGTAAFKSGWSSLSAAAEATWDNAAAQWQPARGRRTMPPPPPLSEEEEDEIAAQSVESIIRKYLLKIVAEREAREEGRIVAADFYVRQLTFIEVLLDVASEGRGMQKLEEARHRGLHVIQIAQTDFSRVLDNARTRLWQECGDPPRPQHPPIDFLEERDGFWVEVEPALERGPDVEAREQARAQQWREAAEAQVRWEAEARRDQERRRRASQDCRGQSEKRSATPPLDEETVRPGQPAPEGRQD